jgi:hypothetical protein
MSGQQPPELSEEQKAQLHQDSLPLYLASTGDPRYSGLLGMMRAGVDANKYNDRRIAQLQSGDREYMDGIPPSDNNYPAIDHQKLKQDVDVIQAEGIISYKDGYDELRRLFLDLSNELSEAVGKSKQGWEGGAADHAHGYFTSLSTWADANSENAELASRIISEEADAATRARNSMPEPIPFNLEQEMDNWSLNPFSFHDQVDQTIEKMYKSQAAHQEAAQVMTQYDNDLYQAGNKQPVFAEPPKFEDAGGSSNDTGSSGVIRINDPSTSASGYTGGPGGPGGSVPTGGGSVNVPSSPAGNPPPIAPGLSTGVKQPGTTQPSGWSPSRPTAPPLRRNNPNQFGPGNPGYGPMPMGPTGGGPGYGPGGGRISTNGFGPGGGGAGAGGAAGPGTGAATGAKPMGPVGAGPGGAAAPGAASAARGAGMGAPMGAGAGKGGQGSEDAEHQRPTYLVEADPDDVFGTSQRTAPPVIGA